MSVTDLQQGDLIRVVWWNAEEEMLLETVGYFVDENFQRLLIANSCSVDYLKTGIAHAEDYPFENVWVLPAHELQNIEILDKSKFDPVLGN